MYGHSTNAMTLANSYYKNSLYFISKNDYNKVIEIDLLDAIKEYLYQSQEEI